MISDKQNPNTWMPWLNNDGSLSMEENSAVQKFSDPIYGSGGQMYMSKDGFQQFICLAAKQVTVDGVMTKCKPNKKIAVFYNIVLNDIKYLVQSHFF